MCRRTRLIWLIHTILDREWETMGFYITLCTVHTTQGQGQGQGTIVLYCAHPGHFLCPGPMQCVWTIRGKCTPNRAIQKWRNRILSEILTKISGEIFQKSYPPPPDRMTHACESMTFPHLRWRVVMRWVTICGNEVSRRLSVYVLEWSIQMYPSCMRGMSFSGAVAIKFISFQGCAFMEENTWIDLFPESVPVIGRTIQPEIALKN